MEHFIDMKYFILDTDIGGDPDDIVALFYGLKLPKTQLIGIITNDEHEGHRYSYVKEILSELKIDGVKIIRGDETNFKENKCCVVCGTQESYGKKDYVNELKDLINDYGEVYYVL